RLAYKPSENRLVWGAVSRAVRAPSRLDREVFVPINPPFVVVGGPNFESEVAIVYEAGYRSQPISKLGYSITFFGHDWDKLRSGTSVPVFLENKIEGWVYGIETWGDYHFSTACSVKGGLTYLREDLRLEPGSTDPVGVDNPNLRNDPDYYWRIGSSCDLPSNFEFDLDLRQVGSLTIQPVPGYTELNLRFGWQFLDDVELAFVGRNLLHKSHPEFGQLPGRNDIERSFFAKITWSF
ncbi:MAG: TonB-dependent receptor plug domain-containing protein, partial [Acidobacteriota bacterium]